MNYYWLLINVQSNLFSNILRHTTHICFHNLPFWKETKKGKVDNKSASNSGINLFPIHEFFMSHDKHKSLSETEPSFRPMFKVVYRLAVMNYCEIMFSDTHSNTSECLQKWNNIHWHELLVMYLIRYCCWCGLFLQVLVFSLVTQRPQRRTSSRWYDTSAHPAGGI
jgi:hypothetical protein